MVEMATGSSWSGYINFTAHSIRGASSSTASNMGISTTYILKTAVWSSESVFENFYYKSIQDPVYGRAVLGSQKYSVRVC